jgi:hypothetical protein
VGVHMNTRLRFCSSVMRQETNLRMGLKVRVLCSDLLLYITMLTSIVCCVCVFLCICVHSSSVHSWMR